MNANLSNILSLSASNESSIIEPSILYKTIIYSITIPIFILTTAGNGIILITIKFQARLLSLKSNFFILSLAFADFLVGIGIMPFMISFTANQRWTHSQQLCDFFMGFDFLCSSASFLTLSAMSIERYKMLTSSYVQIKHSSKIRVNTLISMSWLVPLLTWTPVIIFYRYFLKNNTSSLTNNDCYVPADKYLVLVLCIILYHIPLICMVVFYTRLIIHIKERSNSLDLTNNNNNNNNISKIKDMSRNHSLALKHSQQQVQFDELNEPITSLDLETYNTNNRKVRRRSYLFRNHENLNNISMISPNSNTYHYMNCSLSHQHSQALSCQEGSITKLNNNRPFRSMSFQSVKQLKKNKHVIVHKFKQPWSNKHLFERENMIEMGPATVCFNNNTENNNTKEISYSYSTMPNKKVNNIISRFSIRNNQQLTKTNINNKDIMTSPCIINEYNDYRQLRNKRNTKAARSLGLLVASFLLCWLPYTIFYPLSQFYPNLISNYLNYCIWWLGYLNSTINPFLYVYSNKNIRF